MRVYKVVIFANLAFGLGLLFGYGWRDPEVSRLRGELDAARAAAASATDEQAWAGPVKGIVRAILPEQGVVIVTHEPIGTMPAMTMGFRARDRAMMTGLASGDRIEFKLARAGNDFVLVEVRKDQ